MALRRERWLCREKALEEMGIQKRKGTCFSALYLVSQEQHFTRVQQLLTNPPQRFQWQLGGPLLKVKF